MIIGSTQPRRARWKWAWTSGKVAVGRNVHRRLTARLRPKTSVRAKPAKARAIRRAVNVHCRRPRTLITALVRCAIVPSATSPDAHRSPDHSPMKKWPTMPTIPTASSANSQRPRRSLQIGRSRTMGMIW
jgi:hypothetical protein